MRTMSELYALYLIVILWNSTYFFMIHSSEAMTQIHCKLKAFEIQILNCFKRAVENIVSQNEFRINELRDAMCECEGENEC